MHVQKSDPLIFKVHNSKENQRGDKQVPIGTALLSRVLILDKTMNFRDYAHISGI